MEGEESTISFQIWRTYFRCSNMDNCGGKHRNRNNRWTLL